MSAAMTQRSLQKKVSATLLVLMAALAVLIYAALESIVAPAFDQLEVDDARTNLIRAERAIQNDLDNLSAITADWALWDDAYDYVTGSYPTFRASNLDRPTLTNLGLNLLAIYNADDELVWGQADYQDALADIAKLGILRDGSATAEYLLDHTGEESAKVGLVRTALGPMLISSWPVLRSDSSGPIAGTMIMGQFMDEPRMEALRRRTEVQLRWTPIAVGNVVELPFELPLNRSDAGTILHETLDTAVISTGMLVDIFEQPLLTLSVRTPRNISALGGSTVGTATIFTGLAAVIVALAVWLLLRRIIVQPLEGLAGHITAVRRSGDLTRKYEDTRGDEIGALTREFNKLTNELNEARRLLLDQSFKAGKADTAAEVLHNIRNAMTPLINGIDRMQGGIGAIRKLKVQKAVDELAAGDCPPDRAAKLLQYIESAFEHVDASSEKAIENLSIAARQARQVEEILADQEKHAKAAPVIESLRLDEVLKEATLMIPDTGSAGVDVRLNNGVNGVSVAGHRVGLVQVMGNLMLNAYEAIERSDSPSGCIDLSADTESVEGTDMVRLTVRDSGCGFDDETGERIFQRGYTSKVGPTGGLGLHWCANAVAGMGGRIYARSDGPGRGAEFNVLLPRASGEES